MCHGIKKAHADRLVVVHLFPRNDFSKLDSPGMKTEIAITSDANNGSGFNQFDGISIGFSPRACSASVRL